MSPSDHDPAGDSRSDLDRFRSGPLTFGVIGVGYVGLPLAVEVAHAGIHAIGFDVSQRVVDGVNAGRSHIQDVPSEEVTELRDAGLLEATTDMSRMAECDVLSICVPTPLGKTRDPDISYVLEAGKAIAGKLRPGQLLVLESTTYPGTTREVLLPLFEARGFEVGKDFYLCFSPERVDPGNEVWKTKNTPKVLGGITPECVEAGTAAYSRFIDEVVPVSSPEAAELVKILENTFRAVNIALVNETAQIADRLGVDIWEVIDAAATKPFGFMKFTPGPGLGGHCIPVDPHYLSWKMRTLDFRTRFIELASEINAEMPRFVVQKVREALNAERMAVNGSRILVLGVAYKPNIDDVRESPGIDVIRELERDGAAVRYHDPHVPEVKDKGRRWVGVDLDEEVMEWADLVLIITDHRSFDLEWIFEHARILVDSRNATGVIADRKGRGHPQRWIVKSGTD